jgi:hypothetical protein
LQEKRLTELQMYQQHYSQHDPELFNPPPGKRKSIQEVSIG